MTARRYLLSTVSVLALAGNAFAADMPLKASAPVVAAASSWTGFYIGAHGGVAWLNHEQNGSGVSLFWCNGANYGTCKIDDTAAVFGGQVGYNLQASPNWLIGIEADGSWTGLKESNQVAAGPGFHAYNDKVEWLASVRGRLGFIAGETLIYGTGGVAFAGFDAGWRQIGGSAFAQFDKTTVGWVAGGGLERMFGRNWSARAEFLYYGFGTKTFTNTIPSGTYTTSFKHDVSVVRLGISYRP